MEEPYRHFFPSTSSPHTTDTPALVWLVATYGCESWTLRKNEETHLDASEMT